MWGSRRHPAYYDYREGPSVASMATGTTAMILISSGLLYCAATLVVEYGWQGALNYIWEGDPYPHHIRQCLDDLQDMDKTLHREEESNTLNRLEEGLERAKLDTIIDTADPATILAIWEQHIIATMDNDNNSTTTQQTLQTILATLSYNLDRWAAKIDSIVIPTTTAGDQQQQQQYDVVVVANLKQQKKELSNRIVQMMERTDVMLQFWKEATTTAQQQDY